MNYHEMPFRHLHYGWILEQILYRSFPHVIIGTSVLFVRQQYFLIGLVLQKFTNSPRKKMYEPACLDPLTNYCNWDPSDN